MNLEWNEYDYVSFGSEKDVAGLDVAMNELQWI